MGFKKLVGRIAYGFAWAFAPHPLAGGLYIAGVLTLGVFAYQGLVN